MAILTTPSKAAGQIAAALKLPKNTVAFTLRVRVGEAATLEVETYAEADGAEELAAALRRYRLEELEGPSVAHNPAAQQSRVDGLVRPGTGAKGK